MKPTHVPRQESLSVPQTALIVVVLMAVWGLVIALALLARTLWYFLSWMWFV